MMQKISWTAHVRHEDVLQRTKEERNTLHTIKSRTVNRIGHTLRKNCLLKHVFEGRTEGGIEVKRSRGRRRKQLLDDVKENRGYGKLKQAAVARTVWITSCVRGYGPIVRQTRE
jgi:hypothetical protein